MAKTARYYEDPSIADCCAIEFERIWGDIEQGRIDGVPFYVARERALAKEVPYLRKTFGPVVADRVSKAIQWRAPHDLTKQTSRILDERWRAMRKAHWEKRIAEETAKRGKLLLIDRIVIRLLGHPFTF